LDNAECIDKSALKAKLQEEFKISMQALNTSPAAMKQGILLSLTS
jgi:hypothetical protein